MSKVNLDLPQVAVRERRLGSLTGYQGTAADLVTACGGCGGKMKDAARSFSQCLGCSTSQAACTSILINDAALLSHGPVGCSVCLHGFNFTYFADAASHGVSEPKQRRIFSTNLTEKDAIYGGMVKLEQGIKDVYERVHPSAIFVTTTCASGIIGDDVESVTNRVSDEIGIPVVAIFCEGFRSKIWTSGFDSGYHGIARKLIHPPREGKREERKIINVINFWGSDIFGEWFEHFGYKPNYLTPFTNIDDLKYASEAVATVQACATLGSYLGAALEQKFGVKEITTSPPYGIAQTDRWFRELGQLLGQPEVAEKLIAEKRDKYLPRIKELREKLSGIRGYVTAGASHGHSMLALMKELGIETVGGAIFHHDPIYDNGRVESDTLAHTVNDYGDIPNLNICNKQEFELVNTLYRLKPDFLIARHGGMTLWGAKLGIPSLLIGDEHFGMGYEGLVRYGEAILETIENDEFV
ncbi:MAG: nitrogenase, partial [Oscillospiraceae bacterium]|nr:nitrogenase [Oscillospiraceae bacterium]